MAVVAALGLVLGTGLPAAAAVKPPGGDGEAPDPGAAVLHAVGTVSVAVRESPGSTEHLSSIVTLGGATFGFTGDAGASAATIDATFVIPGDVAAAAGIEAGATIEADSDEGAAVIAAATEPFALLGSGAAAMRRAGPMAAPDAESGTPQTHIVDVAIASDGSGHVPSAAAIEQAITATSSYWADGTNGRLTGISWNTTVYSYPTAVNCHAYSGQGTDLAEYAFLNEAAQKFGHSSYTYYNPGVTALTPPRHLLVVTPFDCGQDGAVAWGYGAIGTGAGSNGWVTMPARENAYEPTLIHEFGHNIGLDHSQAVTLDCDGSVLWLEPTCGAVEYGDPYSPMTQDWIGPGSPALDAAHRALYGFPSGYAADQTSGVQTYALRSVSSGSGLRAIHVVEPGDGRDLYIEYRDGTGADANAMYMFNGGQISLSSDGQLVQPCGEPSSSCQSGYGLGTGVRVVEGVNSTDPRTGEQLPFDRYSYDTPVVTNASYPNFREMAEEAGERYISWNQSVQVDILSISGGTATVQVSIGTPLSPQPTPTISGTPKAGETLTGVPGTWGPAPVDLAYRWLRDGSPVGTALQYVVQPGDKGHQLAFEVTASKPGYRTAVVASSPVTVWTLTAYSNPTQNFVAQAFRDFLGREPEPTALTFWTSWIGSNGRAGFVSQLAHSDEWVRSIVNGFYTDTLGRAGEASGVTFWSDQIKSGAMSVATVAAQFYSSPEYYGGIGGGTDSSWVTDLYEKLMDRTPDPSEVSYWVGQLQAGTSRLDVAAFFYASIEKRRLRVADLYAEILDRALPPNDSGWTFWPEWLLSHGDIDLAVFLATTGDEYFDKAQTPH